MPIGAQQSLDPPQARGFRPSILLQPAYALQTSDEIPTPHGQSSWIPVHAGFGATFAGRGRLSSRGAEVMGFAMLWPTYRGQGIGIAVIGSGAAATHPDLVCLLADGRDAVAEEDKGWREGLVGQRHPGCPERRAG